MRLSLQYFSDNLRIQTLTVWRARWPGAAKEAGFYDAIYQIIAEVTRISNFNTVMSFLRANGAMFWHWKGRTA